MSSPAQPYNYGLDAVSSSTGATNKSLFAPSVSDNVPSAIVGPIDLLAVPTATNTNIPASVFAEGSGIYWLECNGNGNNDLCSIVRVRISPANTYVATFGCFMNNVNPVGAVVGATNTNPYQILFVNGTSPCLYQNIQASITYALTATKIANF